MGAAGFEPAATWSEAKHSVQTELSAHATFSSRRPCISRSVSGCLEPRYHGTVLPSRGPIITHSRKVKTTVPSLYLSVPLFKCPMTSIDTPVRQTDDEQRRLDIRLELLTDDEEVWTAVPVRATGDEQLTQWLSVDIDVLCDLESWR